MRGGAGTTKRWTLTYLGLGANLGRRRRALERALAALEAPDVRVRGCSSFYESEPVGVADQPWFLNAVAAAETCLAPGALLARCKAVERQGGRRPRARWGPREIDVDVLLYGDWVVREPALKIPHPRMAERGFVLLPLLELAGDRIQPDSGARLGALAAGLSAPEKVRPFAKRS